jgi:hypothetical protein
MLQDALALLQDAKVATDAIMQELQKYCTRSLFSCKQYAKPRLRTIDGGKWNVSNG